MTASLRPFFLTLVLICASCSADKTGSTYYHPVLKEKIVAYIQSPTGQANKRKVLTILFAAHQDTVQIELANTYPDTTGIAVIGHDTLARFNLFFVGKPLPSYYRSKNYSPQAAKQALKDLIATRYGNAPIPGINYRIISYWFVNGHLIKERGTSQ